MNNDQRESLNPYRVGAASLDAPASDADQQRARSLAIAAMILGITGLTGFMLCGFAIFCGPIAVVLGHMARKTTKRHPQLGDGMAVTGLVTGYIGSGMIVAFIVVFVVLLLVVPSPAPS